MRKHGGTLLLMLAALIWGMAFAAQSSASDSISAFAFNGTRSILGSAFLLVVILLRKLIHTRHIKEKVETNQGFRHTSVYAGILCGIPLFIAVNLQQFGITLYPDGTAVSGRAGFLTATYVVMIALFTRLTGKKLRATLLAAIAICMAGMYTLCLWGGISHLYLGDLLIFMCALAFAVYILLIDRFTAADGLIVSCVQFTVCGILSLICMFLFEDPDWSSVREAWLPILYSGICSSGIGYTLQIIGQKYAEPTVASIVMSLESVFAALAGWVFLSERLSANELIGCALVFASVILAQLPAKHITKNSVSE